MPTCPSPQIIQPYSAQLTQSDRSNLNPTVSEQQPGLRLPFQRGRQWVALAQIVRLEGVGNYTNVHFLDGSELLVALSLNVYTGRLPPGTFLRVHRKHLLNRQHIANVSTARFEVIMTTGERFPVARRRVAELRKAWRRLQPPA